MHYKNGREAKAGDKVVNVSGGSLIAGVIHSISTSSTTCNGRIAPLSQNDPYINISDCLHADDIAAATIPSTLAPPADNEHVAEGCEQLSKK